MTYVPRTEGASPRDLPASRLPCFTTLRFRLHLLTSVPFTSILIRLLHCLSCSRESPSKTLKREECRLCRTRPHADRRLIYRFFLPATANLSSTRKMFHLADNCFHNAGMRSAHSSSRFAPRASHSLLGHLSQSDTSDSRRLRAQFFRQITQARS